MPEKRCPRESAKRYGVAAFRLYKLRAKEHPMGKTTAEAGVAAPTLPSHTSVMFYCPKCGGNNFGTSNALSPDARRHCHGMSDDHGSRSCSFSWSVADDWRHYMLVTTRAFASREDFEEAYRGA